MFHFWFYSCNVYIARLLVYGYLHCHSIGFDGVNTNILSNPPFKQFFFYSSQAVRDRHTLPSTLESCLPGDRNYTYRHIRIRLKEFEQIVLQVQMSYLNYDNVNKSYSIKCMRLHYQLTHGNPNNMEFILRSTFANAPYGRINLCFESNVNQICSKEFDW